MALIFIASTDAFSAAHTARWIAPIVRLFFPHISAQGLETVHFCIRKGAHLTEYGILGILLWRAIPEPRNRPELAMSSRAGVALLVATVYAATDEYHQSFVPSRTSSVRDVCIDACGAAVALAIVSLANRPRSRRPPDDAEPSPAA